jgi:hypothetical protein
MITAFLILDIPHYYWKTLLLSKLSKACQYVNLSNNTTNIQRLLNIIGYAFYSTNLAWLNILSLNDFLGLLMDSIEQGPSKN